MPGLVAGSALLAGALAAAALAEELPPHGSNGTEADACEDDDEDEAVQLLQGPGHHPWSRRRGGKHGCSGRRRLGASSWPCGEKTPGKSCVDDCNWCCSGWSAQTTMCLDKACTQHGKPDYSGTYCGKTGNGTTDLACTPFDFKPFLNAKPDYCDGRGGFPAAAESYDAEVKDQHRVWRAPDEDGYWVFHACDGSGIQGSDCNGDTFYAEYVYDIKQDSAPEPQCDMGTDVCDNYDEDRGEQSFECRHNKCSHYHVGLNQWHEYKCGWWNSGTLADQGVSGWYEASGWGDTSFWDGLDKSTYDYGFIQLFDWVCHAQGSESDDQHPCTDDSGKVIDCGEDPSGGVVQYYSSFPLGNINQAFTGDRDKRCFCDNEAYGYADGEKDKPPPGGRLFALWWKKEDVVNTLMIQQVLGDELIDGTTDYYYDKGVELSPSEPTSGPSSSSSSK